MNMKKAAIKSIGCFIPGQPLANANAVSDFVKATKSRTLIPSKYIDYMANTMHLPGEIIPNSAWRDQPWFSGVRDILPANKRIKADTMFDGILERRAFPIAPNGIPGMEVYSNLMPAGKSLCEIPNEPARMLPSDAEALAGALCLHNAGWPEVDFVLSFAMTPEKSMPSTACLVHEKLQIKKGSAIHIDACCATQAYQHALAAALINSGMARNVLCTASFCYWGLRDQTDYFSAILGDSATAILVGQSHDNKRGLQGTASRAYGRTNNTTWEEFGIANMDKHHGLTGIPKRRIRLNVDSKYQHNFITDMKAAVAEIVPRAMQQSETTLGEIDFVVTHQAVRWSGHQVVSDIGYKGKYFN
ncbi:MAG: hypothetical protein Q8R82_00625, partial [Hyphomonadaceae bacterium]|nr:hypothetical protein [Hyphomonadaceae bacterium]